MNKISLGNYYRLNKGLEIADRDEAAQFAGILPQQSAVAPVELPGAGNIDRLLANKGTEAVQYDWIQPQADDPEVLTPSGFSDAIQAAIDVMEQSARNAADAESATALSRAARDLKGLAGLRDQVWSFMQALLPG